LYGNATKGNLSVPLLDVGATPFCGGKSHS